MIMRCSLCTALFLFTVLAMAFGQERVDGSFAFQSDAAKKYSLYVPSTYDAGTANGLMLGFHPLNTARWNAISWCDTLIAFAEENGLLLVCPDGGADGRVDDMIDTAFTTALLDSIMQWYTIDQNRMYAMGFSWGGRTTYTYGLANAGRFGGFMPIGAAITGTSEVVPSLQMQATGKAVFIIHGTLDAPDLRFWPVFDALDENDATLDYRLLEGVPHTIDFQNRNEILTTGFRWLDSVNLATGTSDVKRREGMPESMYEVYPNPIRRGEPLVVRAPDDQELPVSIELVDITGKEIMTYSSGSAFSGSAIEIATENLPVGSYLLHLHNGDKQNVLKVEVY